MDLTHPGVWRLRFGTPETHTPVSLRRTTVAAEGLAELGDVACPLDEKAVTARKTPRGFLVSIPISCSEHLFGLGLQLLSFDQTGKKKTLRVNSDPKADLGDSHAPVPFYASTAGYGILIDTLRYATFYMGSVVPKTDRSSIATTLPPRAEQVLSEDELYGLKFSGDTQQVLIEIPYASGVDMYVFAGPTMTDAVRRYNLFSGGGALVPRWGLGNWYRCQANFTAEDVLSRARELRKANIPCDVLGLEPGWQTYAYSCSFEWSDRFPDPTAFLAKATDLDYRINLWTHAYTHPTSPIYKDLLPHAGSHEVFDFGLVPDLTVSAAREVVQQQHDQRHVALGVSGYKLDECDNSDFVKRPWAHPELAEFPSGMDGEQMHSHLGIAYQDTIYEIFRTRNLRTYSEVRSAHALAAPYPFVLYSDLYNHDDFIRGVATAGVCGLLWCPEVRHAESGTDLVRRIQTTVFSPQSLVNAWYIANPPWKQWDREKNDRAEWAENWQEIEGYCRSMFEWRMRLLPYLYSSFHQYHRSGLPPFRALVLDWPDDPSTFNIDDQYMMGDRILVAPLTAKSDSRKVYLPAGDWVHLFDKSTYTGGHTITITCELDQLPVFIKQNSLLPLAKPTLHTNTPDAQTLDVFVFGDGSNSITLIEDDGTTFAAEQGHYNELTLTWDNPSRQGTATRSGPSCEFSYTLRTWDPVE